MIILMTPLKSAVINIFDSKAPFVFEACGICLLSEELGRSKCGCGANTAQVTTALCAVEGKVKNRVPMTKKLHQTQTTIRTKIIPFMHSQASLRSLRNEDNFVTSCGRFVFQI